MRVYIDSDILIWHLRGEKRALNFFRKLKKDKSIDFWIGALNRAEIVFFMRESEKAETMQFLALFSTASVDQEIVDSAAEIYQTWNPSHGIDINDAILAATVMKTGGKIYCLNKKHYPMSDIVVEKAW